MGAWAPGWWGPGARWWGLNARGSKGISGPRFLPCSRHSYSAGMSAARPKSSSVPAAPAKVSTVAPKAPAAPAKQSKLVSGFPGTDEERAAQRRRLAEEHKETLRRLGE
jgi:hypothetical protein